MHWKKLKMPLLAIVSLVLYQVSIAEAHWNMEPRFWYDESKDKYFLRIHNGSHANRTPVEKDLNVCFWIEKQKEGIYEPISDKKCSPVHIMPDQWVDFVFDINEVTIYESEISNGLLKSGRYRAVAMAREQKSTWKKIFLGAALERLYQYFEIQ